VLIDFTVCEVSLPIDDFPEEALEIRELFAPSTVAVIGPNNLAKDLLFT